MKTKNIILVAIFTALTIVGGFLKIPVGPVPITLQFLFTAFAGIFLGAKLGALSQIIYILIGLVGVPVFTQGGGLSYIFKPSFGYLIGFILAAYIIGKFAENIKMNSKYSIYKLFIGCLIGLALIYAIGVPYMYIIINHVMGAKINFSTAIKTGFLIFLPGDLLKCIVVSFIGKKVCSSYKIQKA